MKILAKMEDMPLETISGESKFVLNRGQEEEDGTGGIPVSPMHLSLDHHRVGYSSSSGGGPIGYDQQLYRDRLGVLRQNHFQGDDAAAVPLEQQYSSSAVPYNDDDEESVKTEITEETDVEEGEEDQIIPGLVINTNTSADTKDSVNDAPTSLESGIFSHSGRDSGGDIEHEQKQKPYDGNITSLNGDEPVSKLENIRSPENWSDASREETSSLPTPENAKAQKGSEEHAENISTIKSPLRVQSSRSPRRVYLSPKQSQRVYASHTPSSAAHKPSLSNTPVEKKETVPPPPPPPPQEKVKTKKPKVNKPVEVPKRTSRQRTKLQRYNPDEEAAKPQLLQSYAKKEQVQQLRQTKSVKEKRKTQDTFIAYDIKRDLQLQTKVRARWSSGNRVYKAVITGINDDGTYRLLYNDGGRWDSVPRRRIIEFAEGSGSQAAKVAKTVKASSSKKLRGRHAKKKRIRAKDVSLDAESLPAVNKARRGRRSSGHAKRVHHEFRGLTWSQQKRKWIARIYYKNTTLHLGTFTRPEEAARMYDSAARPLGKKLNFPTEEDLRERHNRLKIATETEESLTPTKKTKKVKTKKKIKRKKGKAGRKRSRSERSSRVVDEYGGERHVEPEREIDRVGQNKEQQEPDLVANFVDKKQEQYNLVGVFTARRRKKRRLYDPTVEAEKPQWLSKDERVGKPSKASTSSSFGVQKKGRPAKSSVSSRASEASSTGGSRRKKKGKARKSGPGAAV